MDTEIIDITRDMMTSELYPGDPAPSLSVFSSIPSGDECNMAVIKTALHCGTHVDAPLHFFTDGTPVAKLPLDPFVGECTVLEVPPGRITGEYVDRHFPHSAKRLLLKSGGKAFFDRTGAEETAFLGIKLIGTDALSIGTKGAQSEPHKALLGEGVALLEGLDLSNVKPGKYFLLAQPLKISGVEASPVRALLLDGYIFWSSD